MTEPTTHGPTEDRAPAARNGNNGLGALAAALAKAQAAFPKVLKDRTAKISSTKGEYSYKYSDLASLLDAVRKPLSDNELALTQPIEVGERGMVLHTMLLHSSGAHLDSYYPLAAHERPQEMGSEITYSRRYTAGSILGIASEDDDDGAAAQHATQPIPGRYRGKGPTLTGPVDEVGKPDRKSGLTKEQLDREEQAAFGDPESVRRERETLLKRGATLLNALQLDGKTIRDAWATNVGAGVKEKDADPAALADWVKWIEARAAAQGIKVDAV